MENNTNKVEVNPWDQIVNLPVNTTKFKTESHTYYVRNDVEDLPLSRYMKFERKIIELGFTADFDFIISTVNKAMKFCEVRNANSLSFNPSMAYVTLFNLIQGMLDTGNKYPISVLICTLFMLREDEDIKTYSEQIAMEKVADWEKHGINSGFFLGFVRLIARGYNEVYESVSQEFSTLPKNPDYENRRMDSLENLPYPHNSTT